MGINPMPMRKDISDDLRETIDTANQSGKVNMAFLRVCFGIHHSGVKMIQDSCQSSQEWTIR